jgi:acetyl esterase/lipase
VERSRALLLRDTIRAKQRTVSEGNLSILVKPIPDDDRPGALDGRLLSTVPLPARKAGAFLSPLLRLIFAGGNPKRIAAIMRRFFNDVNSLPVVKGVSVRRAVVRTEEADIGIRIYAPENGGAGKKPVFYYIHGGGFAAGHPGVVEELCRQIVLEADCIGVQADYRLAPEHPYPAALNDCYGVLRWLSAHAEELGGDCGSVCIAGDSAGGNLAAACAMRDRDEGRGAVKAQVLLYPAVNLAAREDADFHFSLDQYDMLPAHRHAVSFMINVMRIGSPGMLKVLMAGNPEDPYLNPYFGTFEGLPPALVIYGEFDYFRLESEAYARKLSRAAVPVRVIRYSGLSHAFAERIGVQPQAEDCAGEIAAFVRSFR